MKILNTGVAELRQAVEEDLSFVVDSNLAFQPELRLMLAYHMGWEGEGAGSQAQGKRIRPLLVLLSAAAAGDDWRAALPAAAAMEFIHNFSLIHDDIQDQSKLRRGRPTVWVKWGMPQAINAGDVMFTLAHISLYRMEKTHVPGVVLEAARVLDNACIQLTNGQYQDLSFEQRNDLTLADYWQMVGGKTAALLGCCAELGALAAGASEPQRENFRQFGVSLGLAFQVWDDWLGIWGDAALTGKSNESDLVSGKKTLPVLYGLAKRRAFAARWKAGSLNASEVPALAAVLAEEGAREYAEYEADRLTAEALSYMDQAASGRPEKSQLLRELANDLLRRKR